MSLIVMTQNRLAKGMTSPTKYSAKAATTNSGKLLVVKNASTSIQVSAPTKATRSGEDRRVAKRTCRVVKYRMESTSAAPSSRLAQVSLNFTGAADALEACSSVRGRLATFRTVLQSPSSALTGTIHPA